MRFNASTPCRLGNRLEINSQGVLYERVDRRFGNGQRLYSPDHTCWASGRTSAVVASVRVQCAGLIAVFRGSTDSASTFGVEQRGAPVGCLDSAAMDTSLYRNAPAACLDGAFGVSTAARLGTRRSAGFSEVRAAP